jgi:hypothetical protein
MQDNISRNGLNVLWMNLYIPVGENCRQYTLTSGLKALAAMSPDRTPGNLIVTFPPSCSSRSSTNAMLPNSVILRRFMKSCAENDTTLL